jgi:hypothetical protein
MKRNRKMWLILPVMVVPFITLAFWAIGGGREDVTTNNTSKGLNTSLPEAKLKEDKTLDKLAFYDRADQDSVKRMEWLHTDPGFTPQIKTTTTDRLLNTSLYEKPITNPEDNILQRVSQLQSEINKPANYHSSVTPSASFSNEVNRLEELMQAMKGDGQLDPEMKQLEGTLDKIIDIQHPESKKIDTPVISALIVETNNDSVVNGFYGFDNVSDQKNDNAIQAVVQENQSLVSGGVIRLRLMQDIYINKAKIPVGTFLSGEVTLDNERLHVSVSSIRSASSIYPVKLELYDMDGLSGIYVPGAITRDVAKQSADNSLQLVDMTSMDPSLKAQATAAGISTAKSLLSKKVKLLRVMVKAGYRVLLHNKYNDQ